MYLMNYNLCASKSQLMTVMAEDVNVPELRNPVFYIKFEYKMGKLHALLEKMRARHKELKRKNAHWTPELAESVM